PSTAQTSGGATGFHLPSGWRRPSTDGDDTDTANSGQPRSTPQLHEYPPDDKSALRSRNSRRNVDRIDEGTDILSDDDYVPPVREDIFPPERPEDVTDTEALGSWDRRVVVDHPYATAQSPHIDSYDDAGRRIRGPSVSHPYSDPLNSNGSYPPTSFSSRDRNERRPNSRRRAAEESPTIIRHTDAGRIGTDDDDESMEAGRRRRVVELPPAYGEISDGRNGRSRERA
ncbi:15369_t:CDS:1, partial [Acaulospora colombiana]